MNRPILKRVLVIVCMGSLLATLFVSLYVKATVRPTGSLEAILVSIRGLGDSYLSFKKTHRDLINTTEEVEPPLKKILFWNDVWGNGSFYFGYGRKPFLSAGCRVDTCMTTGNRKEFLQEEIDAIIWHPQSGDRSLPSKRSPHTRLIFWSLEGPYYMGSHIRDFKKVFNWTFTYRLDSDIPSPYGAVYRRPKPSPLQEDKNYATGKTKFAAWFVSNCHTPSGREMLVKTLQKWIKIDMYGGCGPLKCGNKHKQEDCLEMLDRDYKFYLAFENSLCKDYATEKLFSRLKYNVIPVVYGLANYTAQLPPHSYIDALDFDSAEDLANYLLYLHGNDTAYNEYFRWKTYHNVLTFEKAAINDPWCDLCEKLHEDLPSKIYDDINEWFVKDAHCLEHSTPKIKRFINGLPLSDTTTPTNLKQPAPEEKKKLTLSNTTPTNLKQPAPEGKTKLTLSNTTLTNLKQPVPKGRKKLTLWNTTTLRNLKQTVPQEKRN